MGSSSTLHGFGTVSPRRGVVAEMRVRVNAARDPAFGPRTRDRRQWRAEAEADDV